MTDLDKTTEETIETVQDELDALKAKADLVGVPYHPSISAAKLREKIAKHLADGPAEEAPEAEVARETPGQKIKRMKDKALALVRVNITCMNPNKREWDGEVIAVGNANLPTQKKFVPFNTVDGYHIPQIMLDVLRSRECQVFYNETQKNGITMRKGKLIKEFGIEVLPPLTKAELAELAKIQAAAGVIA